MMVASEADVAWWPPTFSPSPLSRRWLAWWIVHVESQSTFFSSSVRIFSSVSGIAGARESRGHILFQRIANSEWRMENRGRSLFATRYSLFAIRSAPIARTDARHAAARGAAPGHGAHAVRAAGPVREGGEQRAETEAA